MNARVSQIKTKGWKKMNRNMTGFRLVELVVLIAVMTALCLPALAQETKYASGIASAAVVFGPAAGKRTIQSVYSTTDKAGGTVKVYAKAGGVAGPSVAPTNGQTVLTMSNTDYAFTNADTVVYAHVTGALDYTTVASATTSNVTLTAGVSAAGSTDDRLFEVTLQAQLDFDTSGAAVGTNKYGKFEGSVFSGYGPFRVVQDGTSNSVVNVTVR
jgi:hypothetical protein